MKRELVSQGKPEEEVSQRRFIVEGLSWLMASPHDAFSQLLKLCKRHGFEDFLIYTGKPKHLKGGTLADSLLMTSMSSYFIEILDSAVQRSGCDIMGPLRGHTAPVLWNLVALDPASAAASPRADGEEKKGEVLERAFADGGIAGGILIPIPTDELGVVVLHFLSAEPVRRISPELVVEALATFESASQFIRNGMKEGDDALTAREKECLYWAGEGKTSAEMAFITGLSEHTVNHYFTTACRKLNCVSRIQAVAKAVRQGLI